MAKYSHHPHITLVIVFLMASLLIESTVVILLQFNLLHLPTKDKPIEVEKPSAPYLRGKEVVVLKDSQAVLPIENVSFEYVEVINGCGIHFEDECLLVRSGPGTEYPAVFRLRNEIVLKVGGKVVRDGTIWYKIVFDEYLHYPERVEGDWYVAADYVEVLHDEGVQTIWDDGQGTTSKKIIVDKSEQKLSAYDGDRLFMELPISTGLELTPTETGTFTVFKKTPSRYMQGPLPGFVDQQAYDLPGVPWNLYFTHGGAVVHGAYWHNSFGKPYSHGCVNLPPQEAKKLYNWAPLGTKVIVID